MKGSKNRRLHLEMLPIRWSSAPNPVKDMRTLAGTKRGVRRLIIDIA